MLGRSHPRERASWQPARSVAVPAEGESPPSAAVHVFERVGNLKEVSTGFSVRPAQGMIMQTGPSAELTN
ncbi:hypothetical protein [Phaffia rhodozyma]|uniref:Uncharacterized protein n=1 Tax=Phaffia rhodozyma TaxID=264483 RepID=A0A0F7SH31_PHARH|nr:hypothetical protein [Phaffia rhodozyma]